MRRSTGLITAVLLCTIVLLTTTTFNQTLARGSVATPSALGTSFTYQGQLTTNGAPSEGNYDFQFILYDAPVGGSQVPTTAILARENVPVRGGQFTVPLDFGPVFGTGPRFLDIAVRPQGTGGYTPLTPRQEITSVPYAQYALAAGVATNAQNADMATNAQNAQNAVTAQQVPWSGITGKPSGLAQRRVFVPAAGFGYSPSANVLLDTWGLRVKNSTQTAGFAVPQPSDWDKTTPFTVTLYFALPTAPAAGTLRWRLKAGSTNINLSGGSADSGWDSLSFSQDSDAVVLNFSAAPGRDYLMKTQSWTASYSSQFNTWYLGTGVTTNNDFANDPVWQFRFQRGAAVSNGESYTGDLVVVGADITYRAFQ